MANRRNTITTLVVLLAGLIVGGCAPSFTSEFRRAIVNGNIPMAKSYLAEHPEWSNAKDDDGRTPLHEAVNPTGRSANYIEPSEQEIGGEMKGVIALIEQPESVKLLIENGANVNARDTNGRTALHLAAKYGRIESAELLIKSGANVNTRDRDGQSPLYEAIISVEPADEHKDIAKLLIASGADIERACKAGSGRLLYAAAENRWPEIVEMLIKKGANMNKKNSGNLGTPLHIASYRGFRDIAELLIHNGAEIRAISSRGETALHCAKTKDVVELLIAKGAEVNTGATKSMELPHEAFAGPIPMYSLPKGTTPLHVAAVYDRKDLAKLLIAKGAQVDVKSQHGDTPLHLATFIGHKDMAELLIGAGADVNMKTEGVYTLPVNKNTWWPVRGGAPLHLAASKGNGQIVKLLIGKGADVNIKNRERATPLEISVRFRQKDVSELLRKHGAVEK